MVHCEIVDSLSGCVLDSWNLSLDENVTFGDMIDFYYKVLAELQQEVMLKYLKLGD